jgi:hypothetical protein
VSAEIYNNKRNAALHRITEGLNGEFDGTNWIYSNEVRIWILVVSYLYTIYSYIYIISLQNNMLTYYWINLFWTAHLKMSKNVLCQQVSYACTCNFVFFNRKKNGRIWGRITCQELKNIILSKKSSAGTDDIFKSKWSYFETLYTFLRTQIVPRKSTSNIVRYI